MKLQCEAHALGFTTRDLQTRATKWTNVLYIPWQP